MPVLAVVVLAHADAPQVKRLINALVDTPIVLHCDARTPDSVFREMTTGLPKRVVIAPRVRTTVTSWSLVTAELLALGIALKRTRADYIAVLSGADYPLTTMDEIERRLSRRDGRSWIQNAPLPITDWGTPRNPDGGLWRLQHQFLTIDDQVLYWRGVPLRWPWRRTVPAELSLRGGSQWKVYSRRDVITLHRLAAERPDLMRFWATTLVPDETFAATMLGSHRLIGSDALEPSESHAWYLDWRAHNGHPHWLSDADFDRIKEAGAAEGRLFARKFRSADAGVLDRIDAELRGSASLSS
jgi:hypothetical protein